MEDPVHEIPSIIHALTQSPPSLQRQTIETYFTPTASLTHPFCRTGSFDGSRWLIWCIYRWYKILSPKIELQVESVAYDQTNLILYVTLSQIFRVFLIPFYAAHVRLTTVLRLVELPSPRSHAAKPKYYIQSQDDLYQVNEWVKFVSPLGLATLVVLVGQLLATFGCVVGAVAGWPVSWVEENVLGRGQDRKVRDAVVG